MRVQMVEAGEVSQEREAALVQMVKVHLRDKLGGGRPKPAPSPSKKPPGGG